MGKASTAKKMQRKAATERQSAVVDARQKFESDLTCDESVSMDKWIDIFDRLDRPLFDEEFSNPPSGGIPVTHVYSLAAARSAWRSYVVLLKAGLRRDHAVAKAEWKGWLALLDDPQFAVESHGGGIRIVEGVLALDSLSDAQSRLNDQVLSALGPRSKVVWARGASSNRGAGARGDRSRGSQTPAKRGFGARKRTRKDLVSGASPFSN